MIVREIKQKDLDVIAAFEAEISVISFQEDAVTDHAFYKKKLEKSVEKEHAGMLVAEEEGKVIGWLWMAKRTNYMDNSVYMNFKSFYIAQECRGTPVADRLMEEGLKFCRLSGAGRIVGKVHIENIPMRFLYMKHKFKPTHLSMELDLSQYGV